MKRTQITDCFRNIRKQLVSWLSILVIAMLAAIAFFGIRFTAGSLRENINELYSKSGYRDLEILSSLMFSKEDLDEICGLDFVEKAVGVRRFNAILKSADGSREVTLISIDDSINVPFVSKGSFPKKDSECLIEQNIAEKMDLDVGDIVYTDQDPHLKQNVFTVSGICVHPGHIAKVMDNSGRSYVLVNDSVFEEGEDGFDHSYSAIEVRFSDMEEKDHFSDDYFDQVRKDQEQIENISESRAKARYAQIVAKYQKQIDENEEKLVEAKEKLDETRTELDESQKQIVDGEKKLSSSYSVLRDTKIKLDSGKQALDQAAGELASAEKKLDNTAKELSEGKKQLEEGYQSVVDMRTEFRQIVEEDSPETAADIDWVEDDSFDVDDPNLTLTAFPITQSDTIDLTDEDVYVTFRAYTYLMTSYNGDRERLGKLVDRMEDDGMREDCILWETKHKEYLEGKEAYEKAYLLYKSHYRTYIYNLEQYEDGMTQYEKGMASYRNSQKSLEEGKKQLAEKEAEYQEKLKEYEDGLEKLDQAKERLSQIPENRWIFLNVKGNASYVFAKSLSGNFSGISVTFSLLFVAIGALVIYATVGKTIDEQRTQVGTVKALGFFNSEIMRKYLIFALSATMIGTAAGIAIAYFVILRNSMNSQAEFFRLSETKLFFETVPVIVVMIAASLLSITAVYLACIHLVKQPARILMQDAAPASGIRKKRKAGSRGSLYSRLILRNMLNDPKRVDVTIISVAGSCALILIGLTILNSISSAVDLQFNHINNYDYQIDYDVNLNESVEEDIERVLERNGAQFARVLIRNHSFMNGDELDSARFLVGDLSEIEDLILITDTKDKKPMKLSKNGIYVPIKADETAHYSRNGKITVFDETMNSYDAPVADPYMLYAARIFIMSSDCYYDIYGKLPVNSQYLLRINEGKAEDVMAQIKEIDGVRNIIPSDADREDFESFVSMARNMVILLTGMSFVMAYFILLNLVNMFINQKKKELTIMRINGFTVKEVRNYVGRELILTTAVGILLGLPAGALMAYRIILLLENNNCFDRSIYFIGWLIAALTTAVFSYLISRSALRKVKDLKLTDI